MWHAAPSTASISARTRLFINKVPVSSSWPTHQSHGENGQKEHPVSSSVRNDPPIGCFSWWIYYGLYHHSISFAWHINDIYNRYNPYQLAKLCHQIIVHYSISNYSISNGFDSISFPKYHSHDISNWWDSQIRSNHSFQIIPSISLDIIPVWSKFGQNIQFIPYHTIIIINY